MNTFKLGAFAAILMIAGQATAQWSQPAVVPAAGDYGVYSTRDSALGSADPEYAKAFDNFTLTVDSLIDGFSWTGIYDEPFPIDSMANPMPTDTDFIVEIWNVDASGYADTSAPALSFYFEGGTTAGTGGADLTVTGLGYQSPPTVAAQGGEAYSYDADVAATSLVAGDYWISIWADQEFTTVGQFDPQWQWHLGSGPGDGFTSLDLLYDDPATTPFGIIIADKDLAFDVKVVPEPSSSLMALLAIGTLGMLRRKRA